jgi:CRP-like cAMP-binding protein
MSKDLAISESRTVNLTQKHIRGRLAETLLTLKQTYGMDEDGVTIAMYMAREDLANMSNMTTSNAIRTLSAFAQEKIIAIEGKKIKIIDNDSLERINKIG